jgi:uncharacterized iron-regulated membrane protein
MTLRRILLKIHLYLGLASAIFLVILGLTGSIMAFEGDIDHWLHPALWYVSVGARPLPEEDLVQKVEERVAPARVAAVHIPRQPNLAQLMQTSDHAAVLVNPYDGAILGRRTGPGKTQKILGYIHQFHLRLVFDPRVSSSFSDIGKKIVSVAGLMLCLIVPIGVVLWWRTKRATVKWNASWFRVCFDTHNAIGVYAALFLFVAAFTGVLIGFDFGEAAIYRLTHSSRPSFEAPPPSVPVADASRIRIDQAVEAARQAMPDATVADILLPLAPKASFSILMRVPEDTSETVHSRVAVDQYSGKVLKVVNFKTDSLGYRVIRFNRSIHTGDIWGLPSHIAVSVSSLLLVVMVVTGIVIWWKQLAV